MLSHSFSRLIKVVGSGLVPDLRGRWKMPAVLLLTALAWSLVQAESTSGRDQRRQELRQALQTQRQADPSDPTGEATVRNREPGRHLSPEELLALRRQLQEMRAQRATGPEAAGKNRP